MTETPDQTISEFCPTCRTVVVNLIVERDEYGWVSDTRMGDEHRKAHELRVNVEGLLHHAGAALAIHATVHDWDAVEREADRVLHFLDPPEEDA